MVAPEKELCICLKAKLSNKEIAILREISPDSVKKARTRLRKKLRLSAGQDLYALFDKV